MSATTATTARPQAAAIAWVQGDSLFVEIPCKDGPPYIARYKKTAEGLQAALNVILEHPEPAPRKATVSHPAVRRPLATFTDDQREGVRAILKAKGIL